MASGALEMLRRLARRIAGPFVPAHYLSADRSWEARVEAVRDELAPVRTLVLRPRRGWRRHRAGQHVRVTLELDGRVATRMYSIASAEDRLDGCIELTIEAAGRMSRALAALAPGAQVRLGAPEGDFVYELGAPVRALFVTEGIGIVPIASIVRTFAARAAMPEVVHLHAGAPLFGDELRAIAARFPAYRRVDATAPIAERLAGRNLVEARRVLDELVPDWRSREVWVCAGPELADAAVEVLAGCALRVEHFAAGVVRVPEGATGGPVRFAASGVEAVGDPRTPLLVVAEEAGVAIPHGCRIGICHTCDSQLIAGRVRDLRTGEVIERPGAYVQVCVCAAAGEVELAR